MASAKEIVVKVVADASKYSSGMHEAETKTSSFGSKIHAASGIAAGALGVMGVGLGEFVKKAMEAQTSQVQFDQAVKNSHQSLTESKAALDAASGSAAKLGFNEDDVRESYSKALLATKSNTQATTELSTAEDIARYKHESLATAMQTVIKGYQGSSRAAKELGVTVPTATDHAAAATARLKAANISTTSAVGAHIMAQAHLQDKLETGKAIMDEVKAKVNGMASAYSGTAQGKLETFKAEWANLQEELGNVLLPVIEKLVGILGDVANVLEKHKTIVMIVAGVFGGLAIAIEAVTFATKAWEAATKIAAAAQWVLDAALDDNPIGIVVIAIAGLVAALVILYEKSETVRKIINEAWGAIKQVAIEVFDGLKAYFMVWWDAIKGIFNIALDLLHGKWGAAWNDLKNMLTNIWGDIQSFLQGIPQKILTALGNFATLLVKDGSDLFSGLLSGINSIWTTLSGWLVGFAALVVNKIGDLTSTLLQKGKDLLTGLWNGIDNFWTNTLLTWIINFPALVIQKIGDLTNTLFNRGKDLLMGLWNGVKNIWDNDVSNWFNSVATKVVSAIGDLTNTLVQKGKDLLNGLWDGAKNIWSSISSWLGGLPGKAVSAIGDVSKTLYGVGQDIISGLQNGMNAAWNTLKSWLKSIDIGIHFAGKSIAGITILPSINWDWHPFASLAQGGIVMPRPGGTLAQIGEAGEPEAVVPLSKASAMGFTGGGGNIELHVHFDGPVIGTQLGQAAQQLAEPIRRELLRIQNRNGGLGFTT